MEPFYQTENEEFVLHNGDSRELIEKVGKKSI